VSYLSPFPLIKTTHIVNYFFLFIAFGLKSALFLPFLFFSSPRKGKLSPVSDKVVVVGEKTTE
jgi:hypothetical protein